MATLMDLRDERFDRLIVISRAASRGSSGVYWFCRCDCGNELEVAAKHLRAGSTRSCGCFHKEQVRAANFHDLTGRRFGRLTVKSCVFAPGIRSTYWDCRCECGVTLNVLAGSLERGATLSCGCYARETQIRHGKHGTRVYGIWQGMKQRCGNPNHKHYGYYGGRGIAVCDRWAAFEAFLEDMGSPDDSDTLDRVDSDGDYCLANCRWATMAMQSRNKGNTVLLEHDGKAQCATDWAQEMGLRRSTLVKRLKNGWSTRDALTRPVGSTVRGEMVSP